jgi:ABC-type transport system substrate-binding protein
VTRLPALLAAALLALSAAAWAALGPRYGGAVRVGVVALPASLDPALPDSPGARLLGALVHETLLGVGPEGLPVPGLASGWTSSAGGREWVLTLHPAARFHDDRPVTAEDAVRSLRRFLRSPSRAALALAEGLEGGAGFRAKRSADLPGLSSLDERRLALRFIEPSALPLAPLASPLAAVTGPAGQGCGPFIPTLFAPGRQATLNAFAGHVRGRPYLDEVDVRAQADAAALGAEWAGGRLDLAVGLRGAADAAVETPRGALLLLRLDPTHAPFDRLEARQALASRLDRGALVRHFVPGGEPWGALLPPSLLTTFPPAPPVPDAGAVAAGRLTLEVARDVAPAASQRLVALLSEAGYTVSVEAPRPRAPRRPAADARLLVFAPEVPEAGLALHELAGLSEVDPAVQDALFAARAETRLDRRRALLIAAEQALRADGVRIPLAALAFDAVAVQGLHGWRLDPGGRLRLDDAWRVP